MSTSSSSPNESDSASASDGQAVQNLGKTKARWGRRVFLGLLTIIVLALVVAWGSTSSESRALGRDIGNWISHSEKGQVWQATATLVDAKGISDKAIGHSLDLRWWAPEHLQIRTEIDRKQVVLTRDDKLIWIQRPDVDFAVVGDDTVPRFADDPSSVVPVSLPSFSLPLRAYQVRLLLPMLVTVTHPESDQTRVTPNWIGKCIGLPAFTLDATSEAEGALTLHCEWPKNKMAELKLTKVTWAAADPEDDSWAAPTGGKVERVALSHLVRCVQILREHVGSKTPPLPPETGEKILLGSSGKGRLESYDGVRVLHLEGSPEEMGRQHGELLGKEIRMVVDRLVYGVGVASSFAKDRWFFNEIEEATRRTGPFVRPEHKQEIESLALAAGLTPYEMRLANYFPELFHCSGFALHGKATKGGKLYHGRILDYMIGVGLESNAVVMVYKPDYGNAWANVSYAGFVGSVTAMNEKQVAIGEMGGRGEGNWDGKPMAQLVREVMERCDTIDEAVELMRTSPRTCEYYYVVSDGKTNRAVGIKATPDIFETVWSGEAHPQLPDPVEDAVLLSAGDRYKELVKRVKKGYGQFDADSARELMTRPVCMKSNIQSVLFAPDSLDFWVANADSDNVASHTRYTHFNLAALLDQPLPNPPAP